MICGLCTNFKSSRLIRHASSKDHKKNLERVILQFTPVIFNFQNKVLKCTLFDLSNSPFVLQTCLNADKTAPVALC